MILIIENIFSSIQQEDDTEMNESEVVHEKLLEGSNFHRLSSLADWFPLRAIIFRIYENLWLTG